ncbi:hypothetical protein, partial [Actinomyces gerencseriae]|uniref:hypothetical protein n=1 Tax=Actinomyces gerencseriae TaxID=52769 RepID=UPI0023EF8FAD
PRRPRRGRCRAARTRWRAGSAADGVVNALLSTADRLRRSDEEAADAATALGHRTPGAGGAAPGLGMGGTRSMGGLR